MLLERSLAESLHPFFHLDLAFFREALAKVLVCRSRCAASRGCWRACQYVGDLLESFQA